MSEYLLRHSSLRTGLSLDREDCSNPTTAKRSTLTWEVCYDFLRSRHTYNPRLSSAIGAKFCPERNDEELLLGH